MSQYVIPPMRKSPPMKLKPLPVGIPTPPNTARPLPYVRPTIPFKGTIGSPKAMAGHYSDHDAFMNGLDNDNLSMSGNFFEDVKAFFSPVVQQTLSNTQTALAQAGTNVINNQLATNPLLQAKTEDKLTETIANAFKNNKWYIIGAVAGLAGLVFVMTKLGNKTKKA